MRPIDEIVMHCAATPEGRATTLAEIDRWHRARGFAAIGYHYVVHLDGTVREGRPVARQGAHVKGRNRRTIGVCYIGGVDAAGRPKDTRTPAQKAAIDRLLRRLLREHPTIATISGHNQYAAKACPCYDAAAEHAHLLGRVRPQHPRRGASGPRVSALQRGLVRAGYDIAVDGDFGPATQEAVEHFQRHLGVRADGVPGDFFMRKLARATEGTAEPGEAGAGEAGEGGADFAPKPDTPTVPRKPAHRAAAYSKLFGALAGGLAGAAAAFGLPVAWATPELQAALVVLLSTLCTWAAPANA